MQTENITESMTKDQAHMYRYHRAEARKLATYARECDVEGRATMARLHREKAGRHLEDAKAIRAQAKQAAGNRAFRRGPEAFRAYLAGVAS